VAHEQTVRQLDEVARLARIAAAAPPASTFEGQLQRRVRDRDSDVEFETFWNGEMGRAGKSLVGEAQGFGSTLGGADFTAPRTIRLQ
jgi:hypothetical protein